MPSAYASTPASESDQTTIKFLHISFLGFLLLDWITFGLFRYYWLYTNWKAIKKVQKSNISPFWRAVLGIFFARELFSYIAGIAKEQGYTKAVRSKAYANTYIILVCLGKVLFLVFSLATISLADETSKGIPPFFNWMWIALTDLTFWPIQQSINFVKEKKDRQLAINNQTSSQVIPLFQVSTIRLLLLNILTFRLYTVYWFYKNWQAVKKTTTRRILPFWRAVLFFFFIPSLFKNIATVATSKGYPLIWHRVLSILYMLFLLVLVLASSPLEKYVNISPTFIPILIGGTGAVLDTIFLWPFQQAIRFYNLQSGTTRQPKISFRNGEIILAILGVILWTVLLLSMSKIAA